MITGSEGELPPASVRVYVVPPSATIIFPLGKDESGASVFINTSTPDSQVPSSFLKILLPFFNMYSSPKVSVFISAIKDGV